MTNKELFELCKQYGREARRWKNKFVALLPEVYKRRLYRKKGYGSIFEFAAKLGGVSRNVVEDVIRIDEKLKDKPQLKSKIAEVGLSKVKAVAYIATPKTDSEWANKVCTMTRAALETHIRDIKQFIPGDGKPVVPQESIFVNDFETFAVKLDPNIVKKLKHLKANMKEGTTWNEVFVQLLERKKLKKSRARNLKAESKEVCEVPGCNKSATIIHHSERYAITKNHKNLVSLCKAHHELAHRGYLDEQSNFQALIKPVIDPIKQFVDAKTLQYLRVPT